MPEAINPWLTAADDPVLWENFPADEDQRRTIVAAFAEGEFALLREPGAVKPTAENPAFCIREIQGREYLLPALFAPAADFFLRKTKTPGAAATSQQQALALMLAGYDLLVTGGPGTGKSHLISEFIAQKRSAKSIRPLRITVAAPTGKAAARFQHLSVETQTIHRFLGMGSAGKPRYHEANPAPYDIVIVDEISMVDRGLFIALVAALPASAQLILAGDLGQLPAVEGRSISKTIRFLTGEQLLAHAQLSETFRFSRAKAEAYAAIQRNGLAGISPDADGLAVEPVSGAGVFPAFLEKYAKEFFCSAGALDLRRRLAEHSSAGAIPDEILKDAFAFLRRTILLTELREGSHGSREIGRRIEALIRKFSPEGLVAFTPVIATANNYALSVFNGDSGFMLGQNGEKTVFFEIFGEGYRRFPLSRLPGSEAAYALTIHKSQGSEYDHVFVLYDTKRNASATDHRSLYTAVTRAKVKAVILEIV